MAALIGLALAQQLAAAAGLAGERSTARRPAAGGTPAAAGATPSASGEGQARPDDAARAAEGLQELRGAALLDLVVARVNRRPITLSQLEIEARLALARHGDLDRAQGNLSSSDLEAALAYLIDQLLLENEAARLEVFEASDAETHAEVERFANRFPSPAAYRAFLERFAATPDLVDGAARRGLRAERYLDDRLRVQAQDLNGSAQAPDVARRLLDQLRSQADLRLLMPRPPPATAPAAVTTPATEPHSRGRLPLSPLSAARPNAAR